MQTFHEKLSKHGKKQIAVPQHKLLYMARSPVSKVVSFKVNSSTIELCCFIFNFTGPGHWDWNSKIISNTILDVFKALNCVRRPIWVLLVHISYLLRYNLWINHSKSSLYWRISFKLIWNGRWEIWKKKAPSCDWFDKRGCALAVANVPIRETKINANWIFFFQFKNLFSGLTWPKNHKCAEMLMLSVTLNINNNFFYKVKRRLHFFI